MGNAKVMVFFVSILPLVVDLGAMSLFTAVELAAIMLTILSVAMWTYALAAARVRRLITSPRAMRLVNRGTGAAMAGAAVAVAARG
jgi:threonine/homoserine/homoserine lactone efflux protein